MHDKLHILEKKKSKLLLLIAALLLLTAFGKLIVSSTLAGRGQDLSELENEAARLTRENRLIKEELAKSASISKIASQSGELGLVLSNNKVYVELTQPVAQLPSSGF